LKTTLCALLLLTIASPAQAQEPDAVLGDIAAARADFWLNSALMATLIEDRSFGLAAMSVPPDQWCAMLDAEVAAIRGENRAWWHGVFARTIADLDPASRAHMLGERVAEGESIDPADLRRGADALFRNAMPRALQLGRELSARAVERAAQMPGTGLPEGDLEALAWNRMRSGTLFCGLLPEAVTNALSEGTTDALDP
jgi:hypothetical protein